ncbi:MAG TPA: hypothetical protein VIL90_05175 [Puia sp.]
MDNLDYIDSYFSGEPDAGKTREFEEKILSDALFAEDVAFYLNALHVSAEESGIVKKEHFKTIYQLPRSGSPGPIKKLVYYIAVAAAIAGIIFGILIFLRPYSPKQMAAEYEREHLQLLPVTMSGHSDSIQTGLRLYNDGKDAEALAQFEKIIRSDTSNFTAKEYAGIAALRLKEYDKAMSYFEKLENYQGLYSNPALILQAVTHMERNEEEDAAKAKQLLLRIVGGDLEGKEFAQQWLRKW